MEEAKAESPKREPSADVKKKNNNINTSNLDENPGKMANNGGGDLFAECQHHLATINMATEYHQAMKEEIRKFCKLQRAIAQKKNNQVERLSRLVDSKNTKSQQNANWMTQSVQTLIGFLTRQAKAHSSVTDTLAKQSSRVQTFLDQHNQAMNSIIHNPGSSVNFSDPVPLPPATAPPPFFTSNPYNTQAENFIDNATHGGVGVISAPTNMATILPSSPRRKNSKRQFQSNSLNARSSSISSIPNNAPMGGISPTYQMLQKQQQEQQQQQQQQQQQKQEPQQEKQKQLKQKHQLSPSRQPWHISPPPPSARRQQQQKQQQKQQQQQQQQQQRQQHQQAQQQQQQQQIDHQPNQQQKHQHQPQLQTEQQQNMLPCYPSWGDFDFGVPPNQVNNNSNQHSMNDFLSASVRYERVRRDRLTLANRIQYLQMQQKSINDQLDEAKVIMADIHDVTSSKQWSWSAQSKMGDLRSRMEFLKNQKLHTLNELDQAKMDMMRFDEQHARQMEQVKDVFEATRTKYERSLRQTISVLRAAVIADTGSFRSGLGLGIGTNQDPHPKRWEKFENDGSDNLEIMEDNGVRKSSPPRSAFGKVGDGMECLCREDTQNKSDSNSVSSSVEHSENMMTISDFLEQNLTDESGENFGCYRNKKTNVFGGTDALTLGSTSVDGCGRIDSDLTPVAMDTYLKTGRFNHSPLQVVQSNWSTNRNDGDDSTDDDTHRENSEEDVVYDDDDIEDADIDDIDDNGDRKEENNKTNNHDVGKESTIAMTTRDDVTIHAQSNTIVQYSVVPKDTRFVMEKNSPMSDGAQRAKSENCSPMTGKLHVMPEETNAGVTSSENGQNHRVEDIVHHDNDLQYENRECGTKEDEVIGRYIEKYLNTREPSVSINSSLPGDHSFGLPVEPVWVRPGATTSSLPESPITIMLSKESKRKLRVCTVHPIASSTNSPGSHETVELQASRRLPHSRNVVDSQKNKVMNGSCRQEYLMTENVQQSINHGSSVEEANTGHYFHQGLQNTTTRSQEHNEHCHDSLQSSSQNRKKLFSLKQECSKEIVGRNDMKISPTKSNTDGCLFKSNMDIGGAGKSRICHQTEVEETATEKTVLRMYVNTIKQHDRDITSAVHALSQAVRQDQNNFIDNTLLDHQRLRTVNEAACKPGYLKSADTNISEHHERHHQFNTSENKEGNANDVMIPSHSRQIANHTPQSPLETAQLWRPSPSFVSTSKGAEIHHAPAMSDTSFSGDGTLKQSDGSGDNISLHRQHQQHHHQQQEKQEPGQKFVDKVASAGSHIIGDHNSSTLHQASSSESDLDSSESPTFTTSLSSSINVDTESDTSFLPASAKDDNRNYNKSQKQTARSKKTSEKARTNVFVGSIIKRSSSGQKCVRFSEQIEYSPLELASCERLEGFMNEDDDNDDAVAGGGGGGGGE